MKTDIENLKSGVAKTLTFLLEELIGYQFAKKKTEGYNPSKSIEVYMLNSLHVSRLFWTNLLSFQFNLQRTF